MATQVLRPQDCLVERFPIFHASKNHFPTKGNRFGYTKKSTVIQTDHTNRSKNQTQQYHHQQNCSTSPKKIPIPHDSKGVSKHRNTRNEVEIGQVSIVRRGDSLDSLNSRIKKDITKKSNFDHADILYAGSACSVSPPPSSLPLPSFFKKQEFNSFDDSATRDLRRLLRLE